MEQSLKVGDKAVYPAHGVGEVTGIEDREISGQRQRFYVLRLLENGMRILIPTDSLAQAGLRQVMGRREIQRVFRILRGRDAARGGATWNRRYREYSDKMRTGSVFEIAEVLRDLYRLKREKDLSFCELRLFDTARGLLIRELAVAKNCDQETVERQFARIFKR